VVGAHRQRNQSWEICSRHWMAATTIKMTINCKHSINSLSTLSPWYTVSVIATYSVTVHILKGVVS
jgi:hypothetical protein